MSSSRNRKRSPRSAIFLALVLAVFGVSCGDPDIESPARHIPDWRVFSDREAGVEFQYPYNLNLETDMAREDGQLSAKLRWPGGRRPVFSVVTESAPVGASIVGQVNEEVDGVPASRTTTDSDGDEIHEVVVVHNGRTYMFGGTGDSFERVLASVKFIDPGSPPVEAEGER